MLSKIEPMKVLGYFAISSPFWLMFILIGVGMSYNQHSETVKVSPPVENITIANDEYEIIIKKLERDIVTPPKRLVDANEVHCLALNIWHEARGTSVDDQLAVAHVTKNRELSSKYPSGICDVVFQGKHAKNSEGQSYPLKFKCQFSWYCDGRSDKIRLTDFRGAVIKENVKLWDSIQNMSFDVLAGYTVDPTSGATHYLNPRIVKNSPRWAREYVMVYETDGHEFYRM